MAEVNVTPDTKDNTEGGGNVVDPKIEKGSTLTDPPKEDPPKEDPPKEDPPKDDKEKVEGAPEAYEAFTAPEGVELNKEMTDKFSVTAKELNLPQASAQKLMDVATEHFKNLSEEMQTRHFETRDKWVSDLKADKEFGGAKLNETIERAQRVLKTFGSEELSTFLRESGAGDNNEIVKMFAKIGKAIGEDKLVDGTPKSVAKSPADVIYGG